MHHEKQQEKICTRTYRERIIGDFLLLGSTHSFGAPHRLSMTDDSARALNREQATRHKPLKVNSGCSFRIGNMGKCPQLKDGGIRS